MKNHEKYTITTMINSEITEAHEFNDFAETMQTYMKIRNQFEEDFKNGDKKTFCVSVLDIPNNVEMLHFSNEGANK